MFDVLEWQLGVVVDHQSLLLDRYESSGLTFYNLLEYGR